MGGWRGWQRCQPRSAAGSHCSWWSGARSWQHPRRWLRRCGATACTARSRRRRLRAGPAVASQAGCGRRPWRAAAQQSSSSAVSSPHAAARKRRPGSGRAGPRTQGPPRAAPDRWLRSKPDCERPCKPACAHYSVCVPRARSAAAVDSIPGRRRLQCQHASAYPATRGSRSLCLTSAAQHCQCTHAPVINAPALTLAKATPGHRAVVVLTAASAATGTAADAPLPAAPDCDVDGGAMAAAAAAVPPKMLKPGESGSGACAEPPCK